MCLNTGEYGKFSPEPRKAEKDIEVFKNLDWKLRSPYQSFQYEKGNVYFQKGESKFGLRQDIFGEWKVYEGLHAYLTKRVARFNRVGNQKTYKFIIPKGSRYYIGRGNEIVSDKLLFPHYSNP